MLCNGNHSEFCGGSNRLDVYDYSNQVSLPPWTTTSGTVRTTSSSSIVVTTSTKLSSLLVPTSSNIVSSTLNAQVSSTTSAVAVQTLGIKPTVGGYSYLGCYTEGTNVRALSQAAFFDYDAMTLEDCAADCVGYTYFGVE